jgi:hypothetical protein
VRALPMIGTVRSLPELGVLCAACASHQLECSHCVGRHGSAPPPGVHFPAPRSRAPAPLHARSSLAPCWPWLDAFNEARLLTR